MTDSMLLMTFWILMMIAVCVTVVWVMVASDE